MCYSGLWCIECLCTSVVASKARVESGVTLFSFSYLFLPPIKAPVDSCSIIDGKLQINAAIIIN